MATNFFTASELVAVFSPLLALAVNLLLRRQQDKAKTLIIGQCFSFIGALFAMFFALFFAMTQPGALHPPEPIFGVLNFDPLSSCVLTCITFIAFVVTSFSERYLGGDKTRLSFLTQITTLSCSSALLALSENIVLSLICWHFLSWGIWRMMRLRNSARQSSNIVLAHHLSSDLLLLLGVALTLSWLGTASFSQMAARVADLASPVSIFDSTIPISKATLIAILLIVSFSIKSALFPFHRWLLATLDAPTPLSGLLHAGVVNVSAIMAYHTMPVLQEAPAALLLWAALATISAVLGTLSVSAQPDVKRKLVFSTVGQMGFMSLQCACGAVPLALFHVIAHGLFKCHMFLQSGSGIAEGLAKRSYFHGQGAKNGRVLSAIFILSSALLCALAAIYYLGSAGFSAVSALVSAAALFCTSPVLSRIGLRMLLPIWSGILILAVASSFVGKSLEHLVWWPQNSALLASVLVLFAASTLLLLMGRRSQFVKALYVHALNGFYVDEIAAAFSSWFWWKIDKQRLG